MIRSSNDPSETCWFTDLDVTTICVRAHAHTHAYTCTIQKISAKIWCKVLLSIFYIISDIINFTNVILFGSHPKTHRRWSGLRDYLGSDLHPMWITFGITLLMKFRDRMTPSPTNLSMDYAYSHTRTLYVLHSQGRSDLVDFRALARKYFDFVYARFSVYFRAKSAL